MKISCKQFLSFKVGAMIGAGLIDSINPCAFATLVAGSARLVLFDSVLALKVSGLMPIAVELFIAARVL